MFGACALQAQTVDRPLQVGGSVKAPVLTKQVDPKYSRSLFSKPKEGTTLVGLVVDETGTPVRLHIVKSADKKLDDAALAAVSQWRFKPAMKDETPVAVELNVSVDFRVK